MSFTDDPNDLRLTRGIDTEPREQAVVYLVLSDAERAKGFVRPFRDTYIHVGAAGPGSELRDLTDEEKKRYADCAYVKFETYPESRLPVTGQHWTQAQLDAIGNGCRAKTTMARALAETYARDPKFYGATYCCACRMHKPVSEFNWDDGSTVGS